MSDFTQLVDLASERIGAMVVAANDDFFAPKENLLKAASPVFIEDKYTDRGKWMDGWETRRRRTPGHDWAIVQLGAPGVVRGVVVDTSYFRGNFPESCAIEACAGGEPPDQGGQLPPGMEWTEILPPSPLQGDSKNFFPIEHPHRFTHVRLNIFPDGGVARLRVFGEVVPDWRPILNSPALVDLAAVQHGGRILDCSDKFFSAPQNLLLPGRSSHMGDGWETRRRRGPGHDWVVIALGVSGTIDEIEVDTTHFKGNFPESCSLQGCDAGDRGEWSACEWRVLLGRTPLAADSLHTFQVNQGGPLTHVRFNMFPDGGVARLRIKGRPAPAGIAAARLRWLNTLPDRAAHDAFISCCGSEKWARRMAGQRPFISWEQLRRQADAACDDLSDPDWLQAFSCHPRIGDIPPAVAEPGPGVSSVSSAASAASADRWAQQEQSATSEASRETLGALQKANQEYYSRFGHIFIVCATGKCGEEMLESLRRRIQNSPQEELKVAAGEQRKIMQLRLQKMVNV